METFFGELLTGTSVSDADIEGFWANLVQRDMPSHFHRAVLGGAAAPSIGFAFVAGYQSALRVLVPELGPELAALCATEAGGGRPSAIATRYEGGVVSGSKSFVSLGSLARQLLVVASEGTHSSGRNQLALLRVDASAVGVAVTDLPALPFIPEVPHGTIVLADVAASRLSGDGYADYVKPFRTVEDIHVFGALLGWLSRVGRDAGWPIDLREYLLVAIAALDSIAQSDPRSSSTHVALGGVIGMAQWLTRRLDTDEVTEAWRSQDPQTLELWQRDRALLNIADKVRTMRLSSAWQVFGVERSGVQR